METPWNHSNDSAGPRKPTARDTRVVIANRQSALATVVNDVSMRPGTDASDKPIRRQVFSLGYHDHATVYKSMMTPTNVRLRLEWCKQHCYWTLQKFINRTSDNFMQKQYTESKK